MAVEYNIIMLLIYIYINIIMIKFELYISYVLYRTDTGYIVFGF
jgi:hypothetical protein